MIKFEMYERLPEDCYESLWNQGVSMDDWDYLLFVPKEYEKHFSIDSEGELSPKWYSLEKLLQGSCTNKWYEVKDFVGREGFIGVAYHA